MKVGPADVKAHQVPWLAWGGRVSGKAGIGPWFGLSGAGIVPEASGLYAV